MITIQIIIDLMGEVGELPVANFYQKGIVDQWFPLKEKKGTHYVNSHGELHLQIRFGTPPPTPVQPQYASPVQTPPQVPNYPSQQPVYPAQSIPPPFQAPYPDICSAVT